MSANPNTIQKGQSTTLTWETTNATEVNIEGIGSVQANGSQQVTPEDSVTYKLTAKGEGGTQDATARVTVTPPPPPPPPPASVEANIVETGRDFLLSGDTERSGYGLYSYLLWWNTPTQEDRARFVNIVAAFLLIPKIATAEGTENVLNSEGQRVAPATSTPRKNLNIAYIPVTELPPTPVRADWIVDHYDVTRARALLRKLPGMYHAGPYIVSTLTPLRDGLPTSAHYLFQNLSARIVPPSLADAWVRKFQDQAESQEFWKDDSMKTFILRLRAEIAVLAQDIPRARAGLAAWIRWLPASPK